MIFASRPIRFLLLTLGAWIGIRLVMLWPVAILPPLIDAIAPGAEAKPAASIASPIARVRPWTFLPTETTPPEHLASAHVVMVPVTRSLAAAAGERTVAATPVAAIERLAMPGAPPPPAFRTASRWSGSAWAILRPGGPGAPFTSQLGGSQAGARLAYAIDRGRRLAIDARVSSAIGTVQREAAIGLDWKPTRLPIHLIAEHRIGIEGTRGGPTIGVVGGFGPTPVVAGLRAEAYAQAGVIFRDGHEGFADGAFRVTRPITARLDVGAGAWGGAQRGAARLDVGPTIGVTLPIDRHAVRLSLDWRQRIAGDARPGSGPAVSLGVDF